MSFKYSWVVAALVASTMGAQTGYAAVSAEEAAKLKTTLTPLGGEKAGNKDGTIPAWDGGLTKPVAGAMVGDIPTDLFPGEKPLLQITAKNMAQYADKLNAGTQALLKKFPDTFRVDVYPTHRTAAAPQYVYDNTFKNATRCKTIDKGLSVENCFGGIPFPIPKDGAEAMWNFILRVSPEAQEFGFKNVVGTADGSRTLATRNVNYWNLPYYYKDSSVEKFTGMYALQRMVATAPPIKAGEQFVSHNSTDPIHPLTVWQYLVGQRRVRRAPTVGYDTPDFVASGANYFDEVLGFWGGLDHYDWKLLGKKEMYVPYNENRYVSGKVDEYFAKHHVNPDKMRWELHRVWVVEATLAAGKRHAVPKRTYYLDEDSWVLELIDGYDAEGKLWRTTMTTPSVVPAIPAVMSITAIVFNLQANTFSCVQCFTEEAYRVVPRKPESFYTGEAAAADSAR